MRQTAEINIYAALKRLEAQKGRDFSDRELAEKIGLHRHTVAALRKGKKDEQLSKVLTFFASQGMPVFLNDLISVTVDEP